MRFARRALSVAACNFRGWHKNPRIILTFCLAFILCFLLSDKVVRFAKEYETNMQIVEAFVWTFGDSNSILLSSLLLLLLFADMPFIGAGTPFFLMRITRKTWVTGQAIYVVCATGFYLAFILASTTLLCMSESFTGNMWSETAAMLSYSAAGQTMALPAFVKTLETTTPYACMGVIFLLMLLYSLLMAFVMLVFNLRRGQIAGVICVFAYSLYGFLLSPQTLKAIFGLRDEDLYKANVAVSWLSPLNHATYHMHSFGYDLLPKMYETCVVLAVLIIVCFFATLRAVRKYNFNFTGTEGA